MRPTREELEQELEALEKERDTAKAGKERARAELARKGAVVRQVGASLGVGALDGAIGTLVEVRGHEVKPSDILAVSGLLLPGATGGWVEQAQKSSMTVSAYRIGERAGAAVGKTAIGDKLKDKLKVVS